MTTQEALDRFIEELQADPDIGPEMGMVAGALAIVSPDRAVAIIDRIAHIWQNIVAGGPNG